MTRVDQSLEPALEALKRGGIVVLTGDRLRGGDIDFCTPASMVTPEKINFMATHGRGLICLTLTSEAAMGLGISLMNPTSERQTERPFGNSIEAAEGVTTGISAADRAHTILVAVADGARADHLVSPGHVFPLIARSGGVAERMSAVEGSIDLCRRADVGEAAVICSIMRDDGEMARIDDIADLVAEHGLAVADISLLA
ncbi:3,4-dihydroxy-2-butanone-4-phosphate synthase [Erythrobacter sp. SDW2]|uniref:3,4-dihydroxy-2-butanone-4-phosphate synthase n=1 Tax=Erythrobacter sp. SDW2 TaxID=2907154 RepID=UPI001F1E400B|nr:3,4-dihydroxy-2-butanone-4-phosphate synthase [Erythrobacter sp. SDW2]UIP06924.1 3,4-dihydroxy-2-butanone-4-phosphate synthase [Erythrobacter sp. SDW2]